MTSGDEDRLVGQADVVRDVFESAPVAMCALDGPDHTLIAMNAAYRRVFPRANAIGLGRPIAEIVPELAGQAIFATFDRVFTSGDTVRADEWRVQFDADGTGVREGYFDLLLVPRRSADDTIVGVHVAVNDVTEQVHQRLEVQRRVDELSDRYSTLQQTATLMQQTLLAPSVPILPGIDLAAQYLVASDDAVAGGDWFDAIPRTDGTVTLVVGDVVGHGVHAAAVMSQMRTAVRMHLLAGRSIADTLSAVDGFTPHVPGARSTSLCLVSLDQSTGAVEYCTAGHPPPLTVSADGHAQFLPPTGAGLLGRDSTFTTRTARLELGDIVLLYSDGIIERPERTPAASTAEFAAVAAGIVGGGFPIDGQTRMVDRLCAQTIEILGRATRYRDDVTLLAAQRCIPTPPLHLEIPADQDAERVYRAGLRDWMASIGADDITTLHIEHTLAEYVVNAAQHAYRDRPTDDVTVDATLRDDGILEASVRDKGHWVEPGPPGFRGRGLMLAQALVPTAVVRHDDSGTSASLTHPLTRRARFVTGVVGSAVSEQSPNTRFTVEALPDRRLVVTGDVDTITASKLGGAITRESRAGSMSLSIDLSGVTHLGSAALEVLADATATAQAHHSSFTITAAPGTVAHHVLSLTDIEIAADLFDFPEPA